MLIKALTTKHQPAHELARRAGEAVRFPDLTITVQPIGAGKFEVRHAGRVLIRRTATPFCDGARALLAEGFPPGSILAMKHLGEADYALRGKLGAVAKLTVEEGNRGPRFVRWKAHPRAALSPPVRHFEPQLPYPRPVVRERIRRVAP